MRYTNNSHGYSPWLLLVYRIRDSRFQMFSNKPGNHYLCHMIQNGKPDKHTEPSNMQTPSMLIDDLELELPFADCGIPAGFPSPAQDYIREGIDLNREIVRHRETTFYARICGESMRDAGIFDGDLIVIDRSIEARDGDFIVACIDGEFTVKKYRIDRRRRCAWLVPANPDFSPVKVTADNDFIIWGVVTYTIKKLK